MYEVEFGTTVAAILKTAGAEDAAAVQVGGPSGQLAGPSSYERTICFDDLPTGGAMVLLDTSRNVVEIARQYVALFCEESCGYCTPSRG